MAELLTLKTPYTRPESEMPSGDTDPDIENGRPDLSYGGILTIDKGVKLERLGGRTVGAGLLRGLGLCKTLSAVNQTEENIVFDIEMLGNALRLPRVVLAEALEIAYSLPELPGATARERAIFSVYMAGKKQSCPVADITAISDYLRKSDERWTRGRVLRCVSQIHSRLDLPYARHIGPICPTSIEAYINHIFGVLSGKYPKSLLGLRIASIRAMEICKHLRETQPRRLISRSPRTQATYISTLALKDVQWKRLGVKRWHRIGVKEVIAVLKVSRKCVSGR